MGKILVSWNNVKFGTVTLHVILIKKVNQTHVIFFHWVAMVMKAPCYPNGKISKISCISKSYNDLLPSTTDIKFGTVILQVVPVKKVWGAKFVFCMVLPWRCLENPCCCILCISTSHVF
ncbi:hypothetical protein NQD34_015951 [Periophthalmus magnuspinnatus]|nr:hypothetical protein NQD34_015951 [Periophthalmus magnuspinnatus]